MGVTEYFWPTAACIVVMVLGQAISYRLGCKHGYARGHEDGRKHGATEVANMLNGMRKTAPPESERQSLQDLLEEDARIVADHPFNRACTAKEGAKCHVQSDNAGGYKCRHCGRAV